MASNNKQGHNNNIYNNNNNNNNNNNKQQQQATSIQLGCDLIVISLFLEALASLGQGMTLSQSPSQACFSQISEVMDNLQWSRVVLVELNITDHSGCTYPISHKGNSLHKSHAGHG